MSLEILLEKPIVTQENNTVHLFQQKTKDELLFNSYKKKVQKGGNDKDMCEYQYELAYCYMNGIGVKVNHKEALYYLKISAERGHSKAQYYISNYYEEGNYIEKNIVEAVKWCRKSAEQNNDLAQNQLGCYYEIGTYIDKNIEEAFNLYKKSAAQGNISAQYNLASCYEAGRHNEGKNMSEAFKWYYKSSVQEYHRAQNKLGWFYENGLGTEKNITEAVKWYKKSSRQDNCKAHYNLGNCYKYNKGIEKHDINLKIAFKLYNRAIEQGCKCEDTVYEYALCYELGEGVEQDMVKAFTLFKQSAELDYAIACYKLSECYKFGRGTSIDYKKSSKWFMKAIKLGYKIPLRLSMASINNTAFQKQEQEQEQEQDLKNPARKTAFQKSRAKTEDIETTAQKDNASDDSNASNVSNASNTSDSKEEDVKKYVNENEYNYKDEHLSLLTKEEIQIRIELSKLKIEKGEKIIINSTENINYSVNQIEMMKNQQIELLKEKEIVETRMSNSKLIISNDLKLLLDYYTNKLDILIKKQKLNKLRAYDVNTVTINRLYLRYNYNCGVLHHQLGNYEDAIQYYEEAAYNKYPIAQKALSYCYKHGIYYDKSIENAEIWYNLYINNKEHHLEEPDLQKSYSKTQINNLEINNLEID